MIVGTPPPFDSRPIRARTAPLLGPEHSATSVRTSITTASWGSTANLLLAQRGAGWTVADIHGASRDALTTLRATDPNFTLATDGVHPQADGHWLIARPYLEAWGAAATPEVDTAAIDARNRG